LPDFFRQLLDATAVWGPWGLAGVAALSVVGLVRIWIRNQSAPGNLRLRALFRSGWCSWLVFAGIGLFLLEIQLAPLTGALATLHAGKNERLPEVSFRGLSDDAVRRLRDFEGKVVVLNLWATWCPPCIQELPTLNRLQAAYKDQGLVVIALSDEPPDALREFFKKHPVDLLAAYTGSFDWLRIEAFRPFTLIVDRQGILRQHAFGALSYEGFESLIRPHL
jgi:thiol-disulfide isomerase/thioredoxin